MSVERRQTMLKTKILTNVIVLITFAVSVAGFFLTSIA
jgi:hypothetical protein